MRLRVIEQAEDDNRDIYRDGNWNMVFDVWECKEVHRRNGVREVRKLRSADDRAINEV